MDPAPPPPGERPDTAQPIAFESVPTTQWILAVTGPGGRDLTAPALLAAGAALALLVLLVVRRFGPGRGRGRG